MTAPSKKLPEITISAQDVMGLLLPASESKAAPSRPSATSVLKPIEIAETVIIEGIQIEKIQNKENQARELPPTTDVRTDLELSQDTEEEETQGARIVDKDSGKPYIAFSDVEPDYTAEELAARARQSTATATITSVMVPEILCGFQEAVIISDDETVTTATSTKESATRTSSTDVVTAATSTVLASTSKSILVTEPYRVETTSPTTVTTPKMKTTVVIVSTTTATVTTVTLSAPTTTAAAASGPSTSKTTVTSSKQPTSGRRPISSPASDDFPTRKPCQPEKPYNATRKLKTQIPEPEAIPRPPEVTPVAQRHLKIIDHKTLANATLDYNISTDEISRGFALKFTLREGDRYTLRKDLRKMRLAQKVLLLKMRAKFPVNCNTEDRRQDYLNYFEHKSLRAASRRSDSDDDFDIGKAI